MAKTIEYAIQREDGMFLQGIEENENYKRDGYVIQSNLHTYNEYNTVWGEEPRFIEPLTLTSYLRSLFEEFRWETRKPFNFKVIPLEEK